jgi:hypothetical protein
MMYIVVTEQDRSDFINRVNERLNQGFTCAGGPFITTFSPGHGHIHSYPQSFLETIDDQFIYTEFNQAMILEGDDQP